jgi:hypothetical protein
MKGTIDIGDDVHEFITVEDAQESLPVSKTVAKRLVERFGDVEAIQNTPRDELQSVEGVGPKTAHKINPQTSDYLDKKIDEGGLTPQYLDQDGVYRHPDEQDE